jgi:DNA recombination protein Rad52
MAMPHQGFSPEQIAALSAPLDPSLIKERKQGRGQVSYLEGWHVIAEANRIFGFHGWQRETLDLTCVAQDERKIGREEKPGWGVTYTARVRVTVTTPGLLPLIREGSGAGHGIDVDRGQAHESALKEAETDAMKRALMTFGNPFGLALYDKERRNVGAPPPPADLVAQATAVCHQAGLTDLGISAFADRLTRGASEDLGQVGAETLREIVRRGPRAFSPETVHACNGDEDHLL